MQFLCITIANCLANQPYPFILFPILLLCQLIILICCTNVLSIICQFIITIHSIDKFLPIGNQCFTNHQFTNDTGKFTKSCQWFIIGSYWQWYIGGWRSLLKWQNQLSMTKVICQQSLGINRHHNFWNPHKILIQKASASKNLLWIFGISPT